ncbi:MAG: biopolymer transporter ExbD [Steroidobacteraceae bacterium]
MSMSVNTSSTDGIMVDINTTPLIDVMLVLLTMLIITLPIMTHAVKLDMPRDTNQPPPTELPRVIEIEIDFDGLIIWNGTPVSDINVVDNYFEQESEIEPQAEIHLRPDRRSRYETVAKVLASAQRHHMLKIGFVNVAQFAE